MARLSATVRVDPERVHWVRMRIDQLQQRIDRELAEGEALVSEEELCYWQQFADD